MTRLEARLARMEQRRPIGCETCRFWNWTIIVTVDDAGAETGRSRPEICPDCGRHIPIGRVLQIDGVPWDAF